MSKYSFPQLICAIVGLLAVLLLPYYSFTFLGISYFSITAITSISGMYPVLLVPVLGMLLLAIMAVTPFRLESLIMGCVLLVAQVILIILKVQVVFSGDISMLTQQLKLLIEKVAGLTTDIDIRTLLAPMLKPGLGFYVGLSMNLMYLLVGALKLSMPSGSATTTKGRRSFDGKTTGKRGNRNF